LVLCFIDTIERKAKCLQSNEDRGMVFPK
jgi:hypothetical protein